MDLHRLAGASDLNVLDLEVTLQTSICLLEWPERLGTMHPENFLDVAITILDDNAGDDRREVTLQAHGGRWEDLLNSFVRDVDEAKQVAGFTLGDLIAREMLPPQSQS